MNLNKYISNLQELVTEHPEFGDKTVMYKESDEADAFHEVLIKPTPAQVHNIKSFYPEIVGFYHSNKDSIALEDINCIIIN